MKNNLFLILFFFLLCINCTESNESNGLSQSTDFENTEKGVENPSAQDSTAKTQDSLPQFPLSSPISYISIASTDYIMGKFDPAKHPKFVKINIKYADRKGRFLRKEAYENFIKMYNAAKKEGILLKIISATRNFATQKIIWEGKWTGKRLHEGKENLAKTTPNPTERAIKILRWSSMPGTSRHHWGTDIDLNKLNNAFFEKEEGLKIYNWLIVNASSYGFCQPYSPKNKERPTGYNEEKWHWSYLPIAKKLTQQAKLQLKNELITGFKGSGTAVEIEVVGKFILGINRECF